jgi:hypothetical protein
MRIAPLSLAALVAFAACSSEVDDAAPAPTPLPTLERAPTTRDRSFEPSVALRRPNAGPSPNDPAALARYLEEGVGALSERAPWPVVTRTIDGAAPPPPGPGRKRLARFVHLADLQLADDESPARLGSFDTPDTTAGALRPQDPELCRLANAAVRTINALHREEAIDFVLLGGDNIDSAQTNEAEWMLGILSGSRSVACDSGKKDDPVPGPDNDGKDPFVAEGLAMPWRWVTGNHDVLVQGTVIATDARREVAISDNAPGGTRDYSLPGGPVVSGQVAPDPKRAILSGADLLKRVLADGDGHGLTDAVAESGRAFYTFDVPNTPLRFVILDTAHPGGGADGVLRGSEIERHVRPALDRAKAEGRFVILASHHATDSLTKNGGAFGTEAPDAYLPDAWRAFVGGYDNVLFSLVGHSHRNQAKVMRPADGGHAFWEVITSATADYPNQFRVVEVWDEDNGYLVMRLTSVDLATEGDPVAALGKAKSVIDFVTGWWEQSAVGSPEDQNVELWIPKPSAAR